MIKLKDVLNECNECGRARDWNHGHDHEAGMAKNELRDMISNASKIDTMVQDSDNLPGWVSAYISLAADYMHSVAEYLAGESSKMQQEPRVPTPGYAMYESEENVQKEGKTVPTNYQLTPDQFNVLKQFGAKLSTNGNDMYIPELLYIDLNKNKVDSRFKKEFYDTVPESDQYLASQIMTALKKSINLGNNVKIKDKKYFILKGNMTKNGNFNLPNPYRSNNQKQNNHGLN